MTAYGLRILSILTTLFYTILSLSTCSVSAMPDTLPQVPAQEAASLGQSSYAVTLNILQSQGEIGYQLQQAAEAFSAARPGVEIRIHTVDGTSQYRSTLRSKLLGGEQVDLFHILGYQDVLELGDWLLDLSKFTWIADTEPSLLTPVMRGEGIYGVPHGVEGVGLIANRIIFEAAGIPLSDIRDFTDLTEAFADLREAIDSGELEEDFPELAYVTEFPAGDRSFVGGQLVDIALTGSFSDVQQAAQSKLLDLSAGASAESYVKLMARYSASRADWEGLNSVPVVQQVDAGLVSGRVAIIQQSTDIWQRVYQLDSRLSGNLVLLPIPLEETAEASVYVGAPAYWAINARSSSQSIDLAKEFLTWLYRTEEGEQILSEQFGVLSPYRSETGNTGVALHTQLLSYMESGRTRPQLHAEVPHGWSDMVFMQGLHQYFASDQLDWSLLASDSQAGWKRLRQ